MKQTTLCFLLNDRGEVLLAMKKRGFGTGKWNGVGGKVQEGEDIAAAALREIKEEIGVTVSQAERLAGQARPGQILLSAATRNALPQQLQDSTRNVDSSDSKEEPQIFEVIWRQEATLTRRLRLRHGGVALILDCDKPEAGLGRDPNNEVVIKNPRASRNHARIAWRRESYVLSDLSSNGTFVSFAGGPEIALKREEVILDGRGFICCGGAFGPEMDEIVEFDCSAVEGKR